MKRAAAKIPKQLRQWENYGQPKIALKVNSKITAGLPNKTKSLMVLNSILGA